MPRLADLNFIGNPVAKEPGYYEKIAVVVPKLQVLDDEPIGESFDQFVQIKEDERSKQVMLKGQNSAALELYSAALATVLA